MLTTSKRLAPSASAASGNVCALRDLAECFTGKLAIVGKGGFCGTLSLIDGMPRSTSVVAEEESVVLVVHRKDFKELLEIPRVAMTIMRALAAGLRAADEENLDYASGKPHA